MVRHDLLHWTDGEKQSGKIHVSGGSNQLRGRGVLVIPHQIRGSALVPAFSAEKESLRIGCDILLSKSVNSKLQIACDVHCDLEVVAGDVAPEVILRAKPLGGPLTHVVTGNDKKEHLCRIDAGFSWGKPSDPTYEAWLGKEYVSVQFADSSHSVVKRVRIRLKGGMQTLGRGSVGHPLCIEPTCLLPVAEGKCPKHGGAKQACSVEHYRGAKAKGLAVTFDMTSQQLSKRQRAEARALIGEHEAKTKETYRGDVFFSDSGDVFLMSKDGHKKVEDKPTRRVSVVAQTSGLVALS
jgi:hypothetical protein